MSQISLNEIITHGMTNYIWQGFDHAANCVLLLKALDMGQNIRPGSRFLMTENLFFLSSYSCCFPKSGLG